MDGSNDITGETCGTSLAAKLRCPRRLLARGGLPAILLIGIALAWWNATVATGWLALGLVICWMIMDDRNLCEGYGSAAQADADSVGARSKRLARCSFDAAWEYDCVTGNFWCSGRFRRFLGMSGKDSLRTVEDWLDRVDGRERKSLAACLRSTDNLARRFSIPLQLRHVSGDLRWFRVYGNRQVDAEGRLQYVTGRMADIHAQQLRLERLETATRVADAGIWDWNIATGQCQFSDTYATMLGFQPGDLPCNLGKDASICHPDDIERMKQKLERHFDGETRIYRCELRLRNVDRQWRWVVQTGAVVALSADGRPSRMIGVNIDITDQKQAEARLELAINSAQAGLWDWNISLHTFTSNNNFHTMIGEQPLAGPIPESYFFSRLHEDDIGRVRKRIADLFRSGRDDYDIEFRLLHRTEGYKWIRSTGRIIERKLDGSPHRMIGQLNDINEHKRIECAMREALFDLEQNTLRANELAAQAKASAVAKSNFLANMSHEIRTPMTAILGFAELLRGSDLDETDRDAIDTILRNGELLLTIINDILDFWKIEAGKMSVEQIPCSPKDILLDVFKLMRMWAESRGLLLVVDFASAVPETIHTDPTRVKQILVNLISNAIKFTEVGRITVTISYDRQMLRIVVTDTGIGICQSKLDKLFEAFSQADESTTRQFGGTGLGLTISKRFAEMLGGDITASSRTGEGSSFELTLQTGDVTGLMTKPETYSSATTPMRQDADPSQALASDGSEVLDSHACAQARTATSSPHHGPLSGCSVLLVEDQADNQRLITRMLHNAGARVFVVDNGLAAVEAVRPLGSISADHASEAFDIILMDLQLPVMDGATATATLRKEGFDIPIIALTADSSDRDRARCLQAGFTEHAAKPIDQHKLICLIARFACADTPST